MAYYGVGLEVAVQEIVHRFRFQVAKGNSLCTVSRLREIFAKFDNGNGKLSQLELDQVLKSVGLFLKVVELQALIKYFDRDGDSALNFNEFARILIEEPNQRRLALIQKCIRNVTGQQLKELYSEHSTPQMRNFIQSISLYGQLNEENFIEFHKELSLNISSDDTFIELLSKSHNVLEKQEDTEFQQELTNAIQELRTRIQSRAEITKVFKEFDLPPRGQLQIDQFLVLIRKIELNYSKHIINAIFKIIDKNNSGALELQEFAQFFS